MLDIWPSIIEPLVETSSVEYKSAAPWGAIKQKLMRAAIAMANNEDGGFIVIGVHQIAGGYVATGLTRRQQSTYANVESIQSQLAVCGAPALAVSVELKPYQEGRTFAVFTVSGLRSTPHIAAKTLLPRRDGVTQGVAYVRTDKPSSEPCDRLLWDQLMRRAEPMMAQSVFSKMRVIGCGMQFATTQKASGEDSESLFERERGTK